MNKSILLILLVQIFSSISFAGEKTPVSPAQAKQFMEGQGVSFLENKGQMVDMDGKPVPFVLFKAEAQGLDMYVTEKGLTYLFKSQLINDSNEEAKIEAGLTAMEPEMDMEPSKYAWERIDLILKMPASKKKTSSKKACNKVLNNIFSPIALMA